MLSGSTEAKYIRGWQHHCGVRGMRHCIICWKKQLGYLDSLHKVLRQRGKGFASTFLTRNFWIGQSRHNRQTRRSGTLVRTSRSKLTGGRGVWMDCNWKYYTWYTYYSYRNYYNVVHICYSWYCIRIWFILLRESFLGKWNNLFLQFAVRLSRKISRGHRFWFR